MNTTPTPGTPSVAGGENRDTFSDRIREAAERSALKLISDGSWIAPDYANRFKLPSDFMADVWKLVDQNALRRQLAARLESELADRIVNHMAAEIATDVKQLLGDKERREVIRHYARRHMDEIVAGRIKEPTPKNKSEICRDH